MQHSSKGVALQVDSEEEHVGGRAQSAAPSVVCAGEILLGENVFAKYLPLLALKVKK